jgi:hypothetical protein
MTEAERGGTPRRGATESLEEKERRRTLLGKQL